MYLQAEKSSNKVALILLIGLKQMVTPNIRLRKG
jgi:hypothetical protein